MRRHPIPIFRSRAVIAALVAATAAALALQLA